MFSSLNKVFDRSFNDHNVKFYKTGQEYYYHFNTVAKKNLTEIHQVNLPKKV